MIMTISVLITQLSIEFARLAIQVKTSSGSTECKCGTYTKRPPAAWSRAYVCRRAGSRLDASVFGNDKGSTAGELDSALDEIEDGLLALWRFLKA
jgi:hypothetical protein